MNKRILSLGALYIVLLFVQVLIFNHIVLFNVAVPFVFIYFTIHLPLDTNTNLSLTLSFLMGFVIDIFSDTPGVNALACTLLSAARKPVFYAYAQRDDKMKSITPSIASLGAATFSKYLLTMVAIFSLLVFAIEFFSIANLKQILVMTASSTVLTYLLLMGIDSLTITRREKRL